MIRRHHHARHRHPPVPRNRRTPVIRRLLHAGLALAISSSLIFPVLAQTALGGKVPMTPPAKTLPLAPPAIPQPGPPGAPTPLTPMAPMPESIHRQAIMQSEGVFPDLDRMGAGGQIQEAWNLSEAHAGVYATRACENCVYKVRTRELMTTTLVLPEDTVIASADLGDPQGFRVQVKAANMIAVRPSAWGLDTNLNVFTKSGAIYPFYLRSESFNSVHVPDVVVKILGREKPEAGAIEIPASARPAEAAPAAKAGSRSAEAMHDLANPKPAGGDFVRTVPFDPAKLHGWKSYSLRGAEELKPEIVYRDDFFTYIRYGAKWDGMELSSAYVTIDGIDELVNSRVQGSTFIVESVAPLITLKNGKKFLCVRYAGDTP